MLTALSASSKRDVDIRRVAALRFELELDTCT